MPSLLSFLRNENHDFIPDSGLEFTRLLDQERLVTKCIGDLFPPHVDASQLHVILDIGCGPGGWTIDVAYHHQIEVIGIDISPAMVEYARVQAKMHGLQNAHFYAMDAAQPLKFPDRTFDFINMRLIVGSLNTACWLILIQECKRILRPGGILCLTEWDNLGEAWP